MEKEFTLIDYWKILWKRRLMVVLIAVGGVSATVIYSLTLPNIYKAEAVLLPMGAGNRGGVLSSMLSSQMGGLGALLGAGVNVSPAPQLMAILKSRTFSERMIQKYDLRSVLFPEVTSETPLESVVGTLFSKVSFTEVLKGPLLIIEVRLKDPKMAAQLANWYVEEFAVYIKENALTSAKKNRLFIEGQLEKNKAALLESGKAISAFYSANKISNVVPTVDVNTSMTNDSDAAVPSDGTDVSLNQIQSKLKEVEDSIGKDKIVRDIPQQVYLQYSILRRELLGQVNSLLTQQYEMAKINESKEDLNFEVLDMAREPFRKFAPQRTRMVMISGMVFSFLAAFAAFLAEYFQKN